MLRSRLVLALTVLASTALVACATAKDVACAVINVADHVCAVIEYKDPTTGEVRRVQVQREVLVQMAKAEEARQAREKAGAP